MARKRTDALPLREAGLRAARRRFKEIFPGGFRDATYLAWERDYKWDAHRAWQATLGKAEWRRLLDERAYAEVARRIAVFYQRSKLNMLALYEWMALREALADPRGGQLLATGLYELIHGAGDFGARLERFTGVLDAVPQRQTRLAKWPVATLFPFVALPRRHLILKPRLMKRAAERFHVDLQYASRPNATTYAAMMDFAGWLRRELASWKPRDLIDIQGFIWATSSEEYEDWPWE
jgi:hypothetical protein